MRGFVLSLSLVCLLSACAERTSDDGVRAAPFPIPHISLQDTPIPTAKDTATSVTTANYHPMYIGEMVDSLSFGKHPEGFLQDAVYHLWEQRRYKSPDTTDLLIFVDTALIINNISDFWNHPPPPPPPQNEDGEWLGNEEEWREDEKKWKALSSWGDRQAHPVFIKNESGDTLDLGYGDYIPLVLEAKNEQGEWLPLERPYVYGCGTGLPRLRILPNEMALTVCDLYQGDFRTKMRLSYGFYPEIHIYSNEFWGTVNPLQFVELNH